MLVQCFSQQKQFSINPWRDTCGKFGLTWVNKNIYTEKKISHCRNCWKWTKGE